MFHHFQKFSLTGPAAFWRLAFLASLHTFVNLAYLQKSLETFFGQFFALILFLSQTVFLLVFGLFFSLLLIGLSECSLQEVKLNGDQQVHHEKGAKNDGYQEVGVEKDISTRTTHLVHVVRPTFKAYDFKSHQRPEQNVVPV